MPYCFGLAYTSIERSNLEKGQKHQVTRKKIISMRGVRSDKQWDSRSAGAGQRHRRTATGQYSAGSEKHMLRQLAFILAFRVIPVESGADDRGCCVNKQIEPDFWKMANYRVCCICGENNKTGNSRSFFLFPNIENKMLRRNLNDLSIMEKRLAAWKNVVMVKITTSIMVVIIKVCAQTIFIQVFHAK